MLHTICKGFTGEHTSLGRTEIQMLEAVNMWTEKEGW